MRMVVEEVTGEGVTCVWCHEGTIGRDSFDERLLNKWEHREEERSERPTGRRPAGAERRPPRGGDRPERGGDERPRRTGWDGKPREKKYFRKDEG
jgi:hypothetical protein